MGNCIIKKKLRKTTNDNTQLFSFDGYRTLCKVVDVYDGDTITVTFIYRGKIIKLKVRMYGYDSPELKPRLNIKNRAHLIKKAKEARVYLKSLIEYKIVTIECGKFGKFGRLLGNIYVGDTCVMSKMIEMGHGVSYYGGTKK
tara:strand:- start:5342 stop:5767 length:426 start_codon:yes stop_codon:yes gene_type:complete